MRPSISSLQIILALTVVVWSLPGFIALAANFTVAPLLIDEEVEARDILNETITLTNMTDRPIRVYASVHEVTLGAGAEVLEFIPGSMTADRSTSITSWIEVTRARLDIAPGEKIDVPVTIKVHPETPPGDYHALIGFASGRNRDEIEALVIGGGGASTLLKLTVADTRQAELRVVSFATERFVVSPEDNILTFTVENTGDLPVTPTGEVILYDTAGRELTSVVANSANVTIAPGEKVEFSEELPFTDRLGRNKAYLALDYGNNKASVFDTTFYYSVPWYYLVALFSVFVAILLVLIYIFRRALTHDISGEDPGVHDVPLFYREYHDHTSFDHDLDLKNRNDEKN